MSKPSGTPSAALPSAVRTAMGESARWAPSMYNTQPWRFRDRPDGLELLDDPSRALTAIDPLGRLRLVSCGAALLNASVALKASGYEPCVTVPPDPGQADLVGRVQAISTADPAMEDLALQTAVIERRTHRRIYRSHAVAEEDIVALATAAATEGACLDLLDTNTRRSLADLLHRAYLELAADRDVLDELRRWTRDDDTAHKDGLPAAALGTMPLPGDAMLYHDTRDLLEAEGAKTPADLAPELARSTVLIISTQDDDTLDWVAAGRALQRLLLTAVTRGLVASFIDHALQRDTTRRHVADLLGNGHRPQVMLRIGRPLEAAPPTMRRPLSALYV